MMQMITMAKTLWAVICVIVQRFERKYRVTCTISKELYDQHNYQMSPILQRANRAVNANCTGCVDKY